ncbi:MAG: hypothetical protein ACYDDQ_04175 [Vulcanimicrobiaceae bacterium]
MLDGFLGAVPYLAVAALAWRLFEQGAVAGELGWRRPAEDHAGHHRNPLPEFGDIFRFYDAPARALLARLAPMRRGSRKTAILGLEQEPARVS